MTQAELGEEAGHRPNLHLAGGDMDVFETLAALVNLAPFGLAVFDTELRYVLVSKGLTEMHGQEPSETVGRHVEEVIPAPHGAFIARQLRHVVETGEHLRHLEARGGRSRTPMPSGASLPPSIGSKTPQAPPPASWLW